MNKVVFSVNSVNFCP